MRSHNVLWWTDAFLIWIGYNIAIFSFIIGELYVLVNFSYPEIIKVFPCVITWYSGTMTSHPNYPEVSQTAYFRGTVLIRLPSPHQSCKFMDCIATLTSDQLTTNTSGLIIHCNHLQNSGKHYMNYSFVLAKVCKQNQPKGETNKLRSGRDMLPSQQTDVWQYSEYCQLRKLTQASVSVDMIDWIIGLVPRSLGSFPPTD